VLPRRVDEVGRAVVRLDGGPWSRRRPAPGAQGRGPVLHKLVNRKHVVPFTYDQFHVAFANAVTEQEANELFDTFRSRDPASRRSGRRQQT